MRERESRKKGLFLVSMMPSAAVVLMVACGGDATGVGTKTPAGGSEGNASPTSTAAASASAGDGTTTTSDLPNGGELQGAKLGGSTHSEVETKGDAGPKAGPGHQSEPGRRREDLQAIVQSHRDEARACYDAALKDHPGIEGDLTVHWVIDPAGKVTEASVDPAKSTIHEPGVESCVVDVIKKISFAASKGGYKTIANHPFNFHPRTFGKADAGAR